MNFTIITCTGDRPEAFALCEKYVARQTLQPVQWIVLCDGEQPTQCTMNQEFHYNAAWRGPKSLNLKMVHALMTLKIKGDAVAFIEDDDWYAPEYLQWTADLFAAHPDKMVVGAGNAIYYNVRRRWWLNNRNRWHASLCQTSVKTEHLPQVWGSLNRGDPFIDMRIWRNGSHTKPECFVYLPDTWERRMTIGIKGMPGRTGYGIGHQDRRDESNDDPRGEVLRAFIGEDNNEYERYHV